MRAGDFLQPTKTLLAGRAGYECSVPHCGVRTIGPGAAPNKAASVGQASHIYSAGADGPRGRGGLTDAQLAHPDNGIWTCELHGKDIDNNKGHAFPAGLLRSWRKLHEQRIARASTGARMDRWIEEIRLKRSPLFDPGSVIALGRVTVVGGTYNGAGKTALCEWLSGIRNRDDLRRWIGRRALNALNVEVSYSAQDERVLAMDLAVGDQPRFSLNGVRQPAAPAGVDLVYLKERYLRGESGDDLRDMARLFGVDVETVRAFADHVGAQGNKRFRELSFEPEIPDEGEPPESVLHEDGTPKMQLVVDTYSPAERLPLASMSGGVHTEALLAMAIELAKFRSEQQPTLLILECSDWGFARDVFDRIADAIDDCARHCQVLLIEPNTRFDQARMLAREWVLYEIDWKPSPGRQARSPAAIRNR